MITITFSLNGLPSRLDIDPRMTLADLLRDQCNLTALHLGCEHGVCGACSVLLDDQPARACIVLAATVDGRRVSTIEGLQDDPLTRALQTALHNHHGLQCGYCTPGMLIAARDIILRGKGENDVTVRSELAGHLCRCTGYAGIVSAIIAVARERAGG